MLLRLMSRPLITTVAATAEPESATTIAAIATTIDGVIRPEIRFHMHRLRSSRQS
jgi:hypothetical protein